MRYMRNIHYAHDTSISHIMYAIRTHHAHVILMHLACVYTCIQHANVIYVVCTHDACITQAWHECT